MRKLSLVYVISIKTDDWIILAIQESMLVCPLSLSNFIIIKPRVIINYTDLWK